MKPSETGPTGGGLDECLRRAAAGEQDALAELYDRTSSLVYSVALRVLGDSADAEEVTLDVYLQVWRSAARFDPGRAAVPSWLIMLARSRAIDRLRSGMTRRNRETPIEESITPAFVADPAIGIDSRRVREALGSLSPEQRETIELAFFSGLTHSELARRLGQPLGTVKTRIRQGLQKLRLLLAPGGGEALGRAE